MKTLKWIFVQLMLVLVLTSSCAQDNEWIRFTIREGKEYAQPFIIEKLNGNRLDFAFHFDSTCVYNIGKEQSDWNKLTGMTDALDHIHEYSMRFVWRWYNDTLQIGYYHYLPDRPSPESGILASIYKNATYYGTIADFGDYIWYSLYTAMGTISTARIDKPYPKSDKYWLVPPTFGGSMKAPHDITIAIKYFGL